MFRKYSQLLRKCATLRCFLCNSLLEAVRLHSHAITITSMGFSANNEPFKFSLKNELYKFSAKNEPFKFSAKNEPFKFSAKNEPYSQIFSEK